MRKWTCKICGYIYDEAKEGTPFADLPDTWVCPLCGAGKTSFAPEQTEPSRPAAAPRVIPEDAGKPSAGVWSAICSNLARGCEKQYQADEAARYQELADYFAAAAPEMPDASLDQLLARLKDDLEAGYPALQAVAEAAGDRGTQRIRVWGEKVTGILTSVLERYQREGDAFLENTNIWVCSVCGFLYVGDQAPDLCPVCKVPAWKFDAVEGRA